MKDKAIKIPTSTLFKAQFLDGQFKRYEFLSYYLVFESIFKDKNIETIRSYYEEFAYKVSKQRGWHIGTWKRQQGLMNRMKKEGFLEAGAIKVREDFWIGDGRHRFCCAIILDIDEVFVVTHQGGRTQYIDRSWFIDNGFSPAFVELLDLTKGRLKRKLCSTRLRTP